MKTKILYLLLIFSLVSKAQNDDNNIETFREFYISDNTPSPNRIVDDSASAAKIAELQAIGMTIGGNQL